MRQLRYADAQHTRICNTLGVSADPNSDGETASETVNRMIAMLRGFVADFDASAEGRIWRLRSPGPGVVAPQPKSVRLARDFLENIRH
jgi:hypothetical protein